MEGLNFHQVFVEIVNHEKSQVYCSEEKIMLEELKERIENDYLIPCELQRIVTKGGRIIHDGEIENGSVVQCLLSLVGGKGGFGSMLRSQGGRMASKTTNNISACRDLSGRRLKTIEDAKAITEWQRRQQEVKAKEEERIERKIAKAFKEEPSKRPVIDPEFIKATEEVAEKLEESIEKGFGGKKEMPKQEKRKSPETTSKFSNWDLDLLPDGASEDSEDEEVVKEERKLPAKKKAKVEEKVPEPQQKPAEKIEEKKIPEKVQEKPEEKNSDKSKKAEERTADQNEKIKSEEKKEPEKQEQPHQQNKPENESPKFDPIDLSKINSAVELEAFGMEQIKWELQSKGMKCGGSLKERCERLFLTKNTKLEDLPAKLFVKKGE